MIFKIRIIDCSPKSSVSFNDNFFVQPTSDQLTLVRSCSDCLRVVFLKRLCRVRADDLLLEICLRYGKGGFFTKSFGREKKRQTKRKETKIT